MPRLQDHEDVAGYGKELMQRSAASPVDGAVCYSGYSPTAKTENRRLADAYVAAQPPGRAAVLDQTPLGHYLSSQKLYPWEDRNTPFSQGQADKIWRGASKRFAGEAFGNVTCFVDGARPEHTFRQVELPALLGNAQVNRLNGIPTGQLRSAYAQDPERTFREIASAAPNLGRRRAEVVKPSEQRPVSRSSAAELPGRDRTPGRGLAR